MNPSAFRTWWQQWTGDEGTPFDGDAPAWLISLFVHLALMILLAMATNLAPPRQETINVTTTSVPVIDEEDLILPQSFAFSNESVDEVGANSISGAAMALASAPNRSDISDVPLPDFLSQTSDITLQPKSVLPTGQNLIKDVLVKGATGVGTTGAMGAVDRITHEIMLSLEQRPTLVVWLFDQSISMEMQRKDVNERLSRIYDELGVLEAAGNLAFAKSEDKPLLTSVIAFGKDVQLLTKQPTDDIQQIQAAVASIKPDDSGVENVFTAVDMAVEHYRWFRLKEPRRNVMLITFSDEVGNDQDRLDRTVTVCRRLEIPVYVVGVPAPFGRRETRIKYINPDPRFEQTVQWAPLDQGPESFMPEMVRLHSPGGTEEEPMDSGYGPYSLTRLCYETGGIYFAVHPNRNARRPVSGYETETFSAYLKYFFDPEVMRKYRPDYVSIKEYQRLLSENKARGALVAAAQMPGITPLESPRLVFVKRDEAQLANMLTQAQQAAAVLEPKINGIYETLKVGEKDRAKLTQPRWQAGYDLAMGRALATKVRTEAYNLMLAKAKQGLRFENAEDNTWVLDPSDEISVGSVLEKQAEQAKTYLTRVVKEHPETPWAVLAQNELDQKFGWKWAERTTPIAPPVARRPNNNPAPAMRRPADPVRMLPKKVPPPPPPRL